MFFSKKHNIFAQETNLKMTKIMKFEKVNDTPMRNIVGRAFIRVVKNHNLYNVFVNSFKRLKGQRMGERNPFGEFNDFHTLMTQVEKLVNGGKSSFMGHHEINSDYDKIGAMINHLLHFFFLEVDFCSGIFHVPILLNRLVSHYYKRIWFCGMLCMLLSFLLFLGRYKILQL